MSLGPKVQSNLSGSPNLKGNHIQLLSELLISIVDAYSHTALAAILSSESFKDAAVYWAMKKDVETNCWLQQWRSGTIWKILVGSVPYLICNSSKRIWNSVVIREKKHQ